MSSSTSHLCISFHIFHNENIYADQETSAYLHRKISMACVTCSFVSSDKSAYVNANAIVSILMSFKCHRMSQIMMKENSFDASDTRDKTHRQLKIRVN
jgi:hypothetical protein